MEQRRYAVARRNHFDQAQLARHHEDFEKFQRLHASQPGYAGNLTVELGGGELLTVTLWDSDSDARAAREILSPAVERLLNPLMTRPSELVGVGNIAVTDLMLARQPH